MVEGYSILSKFGESTYGELFKATHYKTNRIVAIKKPKVDTVEEGFDSVTLREVSILKEFKHCNIIQLLDVEFEEERVHLVLEYVPRDLRMFLNDLQFEQYLDQKMVKGYLYQILKGIEFCHSRGVMHRDIKPQNLLLDDNGVIKIADFALSRNFSIQEKVYTHEVVTLWYRAPEILLGATTYSIGIDLWSVGCVFAEMVTKAPLFTGNSEIDQLFKIFRTLATPTEQVWPGVTKLKDYTERFPQWKKPILDETVSGMVSTGMDLLQMFLTYDPAKRISARRALLHGYFNDLDYSLVPNYTQGSKTTNVSKMYEKEY